MLWLLVCLGFQQAVSYSIDVFLDNHRGMVYGKEVVVYYNNSPDTLDSVFFHLYANAFRDRNTAFAKESAHLGNYRYVFATRRGWIDIDTLRCDDIDVEFVVDETVMKVKLPKPLVPGDSVRFFICFTEKLPRFFVRMGWKRDHFELTQWYPKVVVYDDKGWHPDGYHITGEFYGEFGHFDVRVEAPSDFKVGATGVCIDTVFTDSTTIFRFVADSVHTFAIVADPRYWVEEREVSGVLVRLFYLPTGLERFIGAPLPLSPKMDEILDVIEATLKRYGEWYGGYPYPSITVAMGYLGGGMEYPMMVILGGHPITGRLWELVLIHELAHQWFYGVLGSNEMEEAWLDEGMTTFTEMRYLEDKYGKGAPLLKLLWWEVGDVYLSKMGYYPVAMAGKLRPVLTPAKQMADCPPVYTATAYYRGAWVIRMLQDYLGEDVFNRVMRRYVSKFRFKHPTTEDFIGVVKEVSGQDMDWFFDMWLRTADVCDYGVEGIRTTKNGEMFFNELLIAKNGGIGMPFVVRCYLEDGDSIDLEHSGDTFNITLLTPSPVKGIAIDPEEKILEVNRWNNFYPRRWKFTPFFALPDFDASSVYAGILPWYNKFLGWGVYVYAGAGEFAMIRGVGAGLQGKAWCSLMEKGVEYGGSISYSPLSTDEWIGVVQYESRYTGETFSASAQRWWRRFPSYPPYGIAEAGVLRHDFERRDDEPLWDSGVGYIVHARLGYYSTTPYLDWGIEFIGVKTLPIGDFDYIRATIHAESRVRFSVRGFVSLSMDGGVLEGGNYPGQELFLLSDNLAFSDLDFAGCRYGEVRLSLGMPKVPFFFFGDGASVWHTGTLPSYVWFGGGLGMRLGPVSMYTVLYRHDIGWGVWSIGFEMDWRLSR